MSTVSGAEDIPLAQIINTPWEEAAALFEQAGKVGKTTPELAYMLAMCYKRDGKLNDARRALKQIKQPDSNVLLQLGLISFQERQYNQAEKEFTRALQMEEQSYPASFNVLLCRLCAGQLDRSLEILPQVLALAPDTREKRFLALLEQLLRIPASEAQSTSSPSPTNGDAAPTATLAQMTDADEQRLLDLLRGIEEIDAVYPLLQTLSTARPHSYNAQQTHLELALLHAKRYVDRCKWSEADQVLAPLARLIETLPQEAKANALRLALLNLQGCVATMLQDFDRGIHCFSEALRWTSNRVWLYQNLALCSEFMGRYDQAETNWNHYFDSLNQQTPTPPVTNYVESLAYVGLCRLAEMYSKKDRHGSALNYTQRAHRLRPRDVDILDKLFQIYVQLHRPEDARRTLRKLRDLRPHDPQYDLYELDLKEVRSLEELDRMLNDIKRILSRHPGNMRVEDRALGMVVNFIPLIGRKCDQLSEQLTHITEQVRRLPNYQINWPIVHDEMHYLRHEFQKLRRMSNKCLALVVGEEHRRIVRELIAHIDSRIDICISMGG